MRIYGYNIENERRDELIRLSKPMSSVRRLTFDAPPEIDPRKWHRIENQGEMGSCQGHALSSVVEFAYYISSDGDIIHLSPLFAYYASQKIDGILGSDVGSTLSAGRELATKHGVCPLDVMPYPKPVRYTGQIAQGAYEAAEPFKIRRSVLCESYDDVYTFLASGQGGVEIGISWGDMETDRNGRLERYISGRGGHAVCFLGYSQREDDQGRKYLWLANSWDRTWGKDGWAETAPRAVDEMCGHRDTVMVGLSDMGSAKPREINWKNLFKRNRK